MELAQCHVFMLVEAHAKKHVVNQANATIVATVVKTVVREAVITLVGHQLQGKIQ